MPVPKYVLKPADPQEVIWPNWEDDEDTFLTNYAILRLHYPEVRRKTQSEGCQRDRGRDVTSVPFAVSCRSS